MHTMNILAIGVLCVSLIGCVSLPTLCESTFIGPRTSEQRLDCVEARLTNTETMAKIGIGLGLVGIATGVSGMIAAKKVGDGLAAAQAGATQ